MEKHTDWHQEDGGYGDDRDEYNVNDYLSGACVLVNAQELEEESKPVSLSFLNNFFSDDKVNIFEADEECEDQETPHSDDEEHEDVMVAVTNAVVNPWAVMIKSIDALVAVVAMIGIFGSNNFTFWANVSWLEVLVELHKWNLLGFLDVTWVFLDSQDEEDVWDDQEAEKWDSKLSGTL